MKKTVFNLLPFKRHLHIPDLPESFTVTAHTGCEGADDNTLDSIRKGAEAGADTVEIDLHFLPDGTPVLKHDKPTTSEKDKLPTLDSAFELLSTLSVRMNVDVKSSANISVVADLAQKHGITDRIFFTGIEEKDVTSVRADVPGIPYYLNVSVDKKKNTDTAYLSFLTKKVGDCGAVGINLNYKLTRMMLPTLFISSISDFILFSN